MGMDHISFNGTLRPEAYISAGVYKDISTKRPKEISVRLGDVNIYMGRAQAANLITLVAKALDEFFMYGRPLRITEVKDD